MSGPSIVDVDAYLERIDYRGPREPSASVLAALQLAHLRAVPFENLDVYYRRGVDVALGWSYAKIVGRRRGGWCFECNGAFSGLLRAMGFRVDLASARVYGEDGVLGPPFDHLTLLVEADGRYLVDVGFGSSSLAPLRVDDPDWQDGLNGRYRVERSGGRLTLVGPDDRGDPAPQYEVDTAPRALGNFRDRSERLQHEPGLMWTERRFCTRATTDGRITLLHDRLKDVRAGRVTITPLSALDWAVALLERFGIDLATVDTDAP